jgi:hypothetical protein
VFGGKTSKTSSAKLALSYALMSLSVQTIDHVVMELSFSQQQRMQVVQLTCSMVTLGKPELLKSVPIAYLQILMQHPVLTASLPPVHPA